MSHTPQRFPSIEKFGHLFGQFLANFSSAGVSVGEKNRDVPEYMKELLGDNIIPSFRTRNPDGSSSGWAKPASKDKLPFNAGRVVEVLHIGLRGHMVNFKTDPKGFPPALVKNVLDDPRVKSVQLHTQRIAVSVIGTLDMDTRVAAGEFIDKKYGDTLDSVFSYVLHGFSTCPEIELTLTTREKEPRAIKVRVPNKIIEAEPSDDHPHGAVPRPLAGVVWALERARMVVLGDVYSNIGRILIGSQTGVSEHMKILCDEVRKHLPPGEKLEDFLYLNEEIMSKVLEEESHHLAILSAYSETAHQRPRSDIYDVLGLALKDPPSPTLDSKFAARDTAIMLYGAAMGLQNIMPDFYQELCCMGSRVSGIRKLYSPSAVQALYDKALIAAERIAKVKPVNGESPQEAVRNFILAPENKEMLQCMQQAWLMIKFCGSIVDKNDTVHMRATTVDLFAQLVPEVEMNDILKVMRASLLSAAEDLLRNVPQR